MIDSYGLGIVRTASTRAGFHSKARGAVAAGFDIYIRYCSSKQREVVTGRVDTPCRDGRDVSIDCRCETSSN